MRMNLLEQIARHLEFLGLGTVSDAHTEGDIFWGWMPDKPDNCIAVYSTDSAYAGSPNGARIQIMTRAKTAKAAYERSQAIAEALVDFEGYLAGDGARASIDVINASAGLGGDTMKRELYASNFRVFYCET